MGIKWKNMNEKGEEKQKSGKPDIKIRDVAAIIVKNKTVQKGVAVLLGAIGIVFLSNLFGYYYYTITT